MNPDKHGSKSLSEAMEHHRVAVCVGCKKLKKGNEIEKSSRILINSKHLLQTTNIRFNVEHSLSNVGSFF